mgnify:CR=1 FL=1|jgi:hypothetical protein
MRHFACIPLICKLYLFLFGLLKPEDLSRPACVSEQRRGGPRRLSTLHFLEIQAGPTMTVEICKPIRDELAECVLRSNCVLRENRTVQDCIKNPQDLPEQCRHLMTSFSNCKRGLVCDASSFQVSGFSFRLLLISA